MLTAEDLRLLDTYDAAQRAVETLVRPLADAPERLHDATGLDWDVATLLNHIGSVADALARFVATGELAPQPVAEPDATVVAGTLRRLRDAGSALHARGNSDVEDFIVLAAQSGVIELVAHGSDLAQALGVPFTLSDEDAARALEVARQVLPADRGELFAPPVAVSADVSSLDAFLAHTGRNPR